MNGVIPYPALINRAERNLNRSQWQRMRMQHNGERNFEMIDREILENTRILEILVRSRKEVQSDLFSINVKLNSK